MSRNIVFTTTVSRINAISAPRAGIINQQKEASQAIRQITMEYNDVQRKYEKRDKQLKEDAIIKDKLERSKVERKNSKKIEGYTKRREKLDALKKQIMEDDEAFKDLELEEQIVKAQENHNLHHRSLKRQENAARERIAQHKEMVLTL
jgi:hypothetical protein